MTIGSWFPAAAVYSTKATITFDKPAWFLFSYIPEFIGWPLTILFLAGMAYSIFNLLVGFDLFIKQKDKSSNRYVFLMVWLFFQVIYFVFVMKSGSDRWILLWMPPIFIFASLGLEKIAEFTKAYHKFIGITLIFVILGFVGYQQLNHADQLIKVKLDSYKEVMDTGLWIRYNTPENSKIIGASIVQNSYYSHRRTYDFFVGTELAEQVTGALTAEGQKTATSYKTIFNETEFECKLVRIKPDYMILHPWEPAFTPPYMFDYPARHNESLVPIKVFFRDNRPMAIIYKFNSYPVINASRVNCSWVFGRPENITGMPIDPYRMIIPN